MTLLLTLSSIRGEEKKESVNFKEPKRKNEAQSTMMDHVRQGFRLVVKEEELKSLIRSYSSLCVFFSPSLRIIILYQGAWY